jgi:hypothetical protein
VAAPTNASTVLENRLGGTSLTLIVRATIQQMARAV